MASTSASSSPPGSVTEATTASMLPDEIVTKIFSYLSLVEIARGARVCRTWRSALMKKKSLWSSRKYQRLRTLCEEELKAIAVGMPQLKCLHIVTAVETTIHIAWPNAAISLGCDSTGQTISKMPFCVKFKTESVVVDAFAFPVCHKWVRCKELKKIYVTDPCFIARNNLQALSNYSDSSTHSVTCDEKVYCAFCTYSHHLLCSSPKCPAKELQNLKLCLKRQPEESNASSCNTTESSVSSRKCRHMGETPCSTVSITETKNTSRIPLMFSALQEVNVLTSFMTSKEIEHLCTISRPRLLRVRYRFFGFSFIRQLCSSLEELIISDSLELPSSTDLLQLRKLRVLQLKHCHNEAKSVLEQIFHQQSIP